ncbi:accessory Sec system translocase SecA2 [Planococcus liqunii]|uniref:Protein translocase subunit SecA n=1 Tax=Planococcus liqunii TaxID=3058394 RepID=A0ABT8MN79_9BACL|nr:MULTISPECIES: accessory Sec system translocase SecA2 [unclassified Planococcus (in: firmicutes)]MDN7226225.1 accessory Sec system translocase SecA2 [Planococcus sp. N064]WKA50004.1 accessory Sec system translocase SecA2 [Planococcus sp. N056]
MVTLLKRSTKYSTRHLKKYNKIVNEINKLEEKYQAMSDEELQKMTPLFKEKLQNNTKIEKIIPDAFAVVREASKRILNMRHFDVQLIGGLVLAEGNIAEMPTGEGKTLVASLPAYLRALEGKGVHIITVNDYLANRDFEQIGKIHRFLGLTVGLNLPLMDSEDKKDAYAADITYGVGTEFGFDYLRDNMVDTKDNQVQRPYHYAIIDEVDSVLIDEAKTPLIVAGKMKASTELHEVSALLASRFVADIDYDFDEETKATSLTETGIEKVEKAFGVDNLYELEHQTLYHYVIMAVRARVMFKKDVDYIVKDGKIVLVDMFTGRTMDGRTLSDGLHQAIEAKEKVEVTEENKAQAQITIQNYFRMYPILSGMTGTAKTQEKEFMDVYRMGVLQVPTNNPRLRIDLPDRVFQTSEQKYKEVTRQVLEHHKKGQPVLIGTTSILQSEEVAKYLKGENLNFQLLNAKSVEQEVELISQAGQLNQITVATNMAGRGTDIVLGDGVSSIGGLHVIGTEKHESRRIDNQLRGRSGRQGDPGSTQFVISLEDDMFKRFAKEEIEKFAKKITTTSEGEVLNKEVQELTERTQRIVEGSHFSMREYNLKLDDVINDQRQIIYDLRSRILDGADNTKILKDMVMDGTAYLLSQLMIEGHNAKELQYSMQQLLGQKQDLVGLDIQAGKIEALAKSLTKDSLNLITAHEDNLRFQKTLPYVMKVYIDQIWVKHLESMSYLKEGIGLRSYQQEDPLRIYQREGLELFEMNFQSLRFSVASEILSFLRNLDKEEKEKTV